MNQKEGPLEFFSIHDQCQVLQPKPIKGQKKGGCTARSSKIFPVEISETEKLKFVPSSKRMLTMFSGHFPKCESLKTSGLSEEEAIYTERREVEGDQTK